MKRWFVLGRIFLVLMVVATFDVNCAKGDAPGKETGTKKAEAPPKTIVAKVNGKEITMAQLMKVMDSIRTMRFIGRRPGEGDIVQIKKDALNSLIFTQLARQYAEMHVEITEKDIDGEVEKLKTHLKTDQAYQDYLKKNRFTEENLRKNIEERLRMQKLYEQEVASKAVFDEEEARKEYAAQKKRFTIPERIKVVDIYIHPGKDKKKGKQKAEEIAAELKEVKDVSKLKDRTGMSIKTVTLYKDKDSELFRKVKGLQPSELSPVIEEEGGYHIFIIKKKMPEELTPFDQTKKFFQSKAKQERAKEWFEELKAGATIEIMTEQVEKKIDDEKKPSN